MTNLETETHSELPVSPGDNPGDGAPDIDVQLLEFKDQVDWLMGKINDDPAVRDRLLCELYVNFANIERMFREITTTMQAEGMSGLLKGMMGRKK